MDNTIASSANTELNDRVLWFDGTSVVDSNQLLNLLEKGVPPNKLSVEHITDEIKQYNRIASSDRQIHEKHTCQSLSFDWNIPVEYKQLDICEFVFQQLENQLNNYDFTEEQKSQRFSRVSEELTIYERKDLFSVLKTLIYIINTFRSKKIVWGVGRGSSVSSYVLYLLGVHDIDSVEYQLDITDFLRSDEDD